MNKSVKFLICILLTMCAAVAYSEIIVSKDRFDGSITIATKQEERDGIYILASISEKYIGKPKSQRISTRVDILHKSVHKEWKYLKCHSMQWMIDGRPLKVGSSKHQGDVISGDSSVSVLEFVIVSTNIDIIGAIARAKTVEYKICNDEFVLQQSEMDDMKVLFDKWNEN